MESNEYLIHLLHESLDNLRESMRREQERMVVDEIHYHNAFPFTCTTGGCAGVDPVFATYLALLAELNALGKEFPGYALNARHLP